MIEQLAHINFFTVRVQEMLDFYTTGLGLKIKFTLDDDEGKPFGWYVGCGNRTFIELFDQAGAVKKWGGQIEELIHGTRFRHFCLEVKNLESYVVGLQSRGIASSKITVGMDHSKQAWIADPDGNRIELMEYTSKSLQL